MLILSNWNDDWLWFDSSKVSLTPSKEPNRPIVGPNWAPLWIFKVPKKKKIYNIGDEIESNILILTLTNSNDLRLRLVLSKVSSDS